MLPHRLLEILHWFPSPPLLMHETVLLIICGDSIILCTSSHSISEVYYWSYGVIEVHNIIWTWFLEIQIPFNVYWLFVLLLCKLSVYPLPIFFYSGFSGSMWYQPYIGWKILQVNDLFLYRALNLHVVTSIGIYIWSFPPCFYA